MRPDVERAVLTACLALVVAAFVAAAFAVGPVARVAPLVAGLPTLALLLFELAGDVARSRRPSNQVEDRPEPAMRGLAGWLAILLGFAAVAGLPLGVPAWLIVFLRVRAGEPWRVAAGYGGGLALVLYGVLVHLLRVPLDAGAFMSWAA